MLKQLYIKDFILIDNIQLDFHSKMSAFCGETGAGKSIFIDALGLLKGNRIQGSQVRENCDKAIIEGCFEINANHPVNKKLEEAGFDTSEETLIITREIRQDGKSMVRINHRTTTLSFLKDVMESLIDIHSQHDTQILLNPKYHLNLLDAYVKPDCLDEVSKLYQEYKNKKNALDKALKEDYNEDDLEYFIRQFNEIDEADISEEDYDALQSQQKKMNAFEKINQHVSTSLELLNDDINDKLYQIHKELSNIENWDEQIKSLNEKVLDAYYSVNDVSEELSDYYHSLEYDENLFNEIQERLFTYSQLKRKYGISISSILRKKEELQEKIYRIQNRKQFVEEQTLKVNKAYDTYLTKAKELSELRKSKARQLEKEIVNELKDLYLEHTQFKVNFLEIEGNSTGIDQVEFMISMNVGQSLQPLSDVASGGELSRIMLGLKTIFTSLQHINTIVFDEIDTGVSGKVALAIGKKMKKIAQNTQVFCVTHLSPVAACATRQYLVEKNVEDHKTVTSITCLNEEERIRQLALISSNSTSDAAIHAAKELLDSAK